MMRGLMISIESLLVVVDSDLQQVIIDPFGCLDASVAEAVANVIERVVGFFVHHSVGDAVPECVRRDVTGIAARPVDLVWAYRCCFCDFVKHVPHALLGDPV